MSDAEASTNSTDSAGVSPEERFCIHCGYNLRGLESRNCPECGYEILPQAVSSIPWEHRKQLGRLRAFWRTLRLASLRPVRLARATGTESDEKSAKKFARIISLAAAVPLILLFTAFGDEAIPRIPILAPPGMLDKWSLGRQLLWELQMMWLGGVKLLCIFPLGILLVFWIVNVWTWPYLQRSQISSPMRIRAATASRYCCAAQFWLIPSCIPILIFYWSHTFEIALADVGGLLILDLSWLIPVWYLWNAMRFSATVTDGGFWRGILTLILLSIAWLTTAFVVFSTIPIIAGFLAIVIRSMIM